MQLPTIPLRQYNPKRVIHDFTTQVKIRPFIHEPDDFGDLFETHESYRQVEHLAQIRLGPKDFVLFQEYRNKRLQKLPSECLLSLQLEFPIGKSLPPSTKEKEKIHLLLHSRRNKQNSSCPLASSTNYGINSTNNQIAHMRRKCRVQLQWRQIRLMYPVRQSIL